MEIAILSENLEHLTGLIGKEDVIRNNDGRSATWFQNTHHMLDKIELFIACGNREIIAVWCLIGSLWFQREDWS